MITSLSNNKKLLNSRRKFNKDNNFMNLRKEYLKRTEGQIVTKKASKKVLESIRKDFVNRRRKEILIFVVSIFFATIICYVVINTIIEREHRIFNERTLIISERENNKYLKHIKQGDVWFNDQKWHNAIFKYKEALAIHPNYYEINYRLAQAYCYRCKYEFEDCDKGKKLLDNLFHKFPNKTELYILKDVLQIEYSTN